MTQWTWGNIDDEVEWIDSPLCAYNRHTNLFPNPESREEKNNDTLADPPLHEPVSTSDFIVAGKPRRKIIMTQLAAPPPAGPCFQIRKAEGGKKT